MKPMAIVCDDYKLPHYLRRLSLERIEHKTTSGPRPNVTTITVFTNNFNLIKGVCEDLETYFNARK
jgi:hypothetical protein